MENGLRTVPVSTREYTTSSRCRTGLRPLSLSILSQNGNGAKESDDANRAWNPRERVIIREMEDYLTRRSEVILVEVRELEAYVFCPTDVMGYCRLSGLECVHNQERQIKCVFVKTKEGNMVADVGQYAMMRKRMQTNYPRDHSAHEHEAEGAVDHHESKAKNDEPSHRGNSGEAPPGNLSLGRQDLGGGSGTVRENERN